MPELSAARRATRNGGWLRVLPPAARFVLQGGPDARAAAGAAFGMPLPEVSCRAALRDERAALWLGPDEQLLLGPAGDRPLIAAGLEAALAGITHSSVDVSQRQVALRVSGPHAATILNTACPLDLDAAEFPPGMCTRTLFGKADIILWRRGNAEFHLEVWRSFSDYVLGCLDEAARDFIAAEN